MTQVARGARLAAEPVLRRAAARDRSGLQESARDPGRRRRRARVLPGDHRRRRVHLRQDRPPAAQPRVQPAGADHPADRSRAAAVLRHRVGVPRPVTRWARCRCASRPPNPSTSAALHRARRGSRGARFGQLRAQQVDVRRRQRARLRRAGRREPFDFGAGVGSGAHGPAPPVQRLRAVLPAVPRRRHDQLPRAVGPAHRRDPRHRHGRGTATASAPTGRTALRACRSSATPSATSRSRKSTCGQWSFELPPTSACCSTFEAFNLFNWDNIELAGTPVTNYCAAPIAGRLRFRRADQSELPVADDKIPTSTRSGSCCCTNIPGAPRQIQLGVRFMF